MDTDIKLGTNWAVIPAPNGDVPLQSGYDCLMQDIRLEAASVAGELFYDELWGWSLIDFLHSEDEPLTVLEITERIRTKLERRSIIEADSILIEIQFGKDIITAFATFRLVGDTVTRKVGVTLNPVTVEVVLID